MLFIRADIMRIYTTIFVLSTVKFTTGTPICTCDYFVNSCDVNCCCDADCSKIDKQAFSHCLNEPERPNGECISRHVIFFNNTAYNTSYSSSNLLCIERSRNTGQHEYQAPKIVESDRQAVEYLNAFSSDIYYPSFTENDSIYGDTAYKVGDPVVVFNVQEETHLYFSFPRVTYSNGCRFNNHAKFFVDESTECWLAITSPNDCLKLHQIQPTFISMLNHAVVKQLPAALNSEIAQVIFKYKLPGSLKCVALNSSDVSDVPPLTIENNQCQNIVEKVTYEFNVNSSFGIERVEACIQLGNISIGDRSFVTTISQQFSTKFKWSRNAGTRFPGSNPGYRFGRPVIAGTIISNGSTDAIKLSQNSDNWLTVLKPDSSGQCSNTARQNIYFKQDLQTGCLLEINSAQTPPGCLKVQNQLDNIMGKLLDIRIASFVNSTVNNIHDWVRVIEVNKPNVKEVITTSGVCSLSFRLNLLIMYASTGKVSNPQDMIVGARATYKHKTEVPLMCTMPDCNGVNARTQLQPVILSVQFVDVSFKAYPIIAKIPTINAKLPTDFFYPFTGSDSAQLNISLILLLLVILNLLN